MYTAYLHTPLTSIVIALILGALLGLERSLAGKNAGLRTYGLVSMGACLFTLMSVLVAPNGLENTPGQMYVLQGLIVGIGFIGGGAILHNHVHNKDHASGVTTAAGLWIAAGIGAATGFGYYTLATFTTVVTLIVFTVFWFVEHKVIEPHERKN
jgi:putative Mg2+ transporter-C (MgtC) family protein